MSKIREMKKRAYIQAHLGRWHRSHSEAVQRWDDIRLATESTSCSWELSHGVCAAAAQTQAPCCCDVPGRAVRWRRQPWRMVLHTQGAPPSLFHLDVSLEGRQVGGTCEEHGDMGRQAAPAHRVMKI